MSDPETTLKSELERYPYEVEPAERGAYFDGLVGRWPAPELVAGIAAWRSDCLLPLLEAAQDSKALSDEGRREVRNVVWLAPADDRGEDAQDQVLGELADRGLAATLVSEVAGAPRAPRFLALARRLDGKDAAFAPLTTLRSQALDLLLARLLGLRVAILVPDPLSEAMGQGTMPQLMTVAQTASVMVVPKTTNLTFWTMASHAQLVDAERAGDDALIGQVLDALAEPRRAPRRSAPARRPRDPLAPLVRASANVAAGMANLKFPPLVGGSAAPAPPEPEPTREDLERRIASLELQLSEARARLAALDD